MNDKSWFTYRPTECATLSLKPKKRLQKVALGGAFLLILAALSGMLLQRKADKALSKNYVFTYKAAIAEFYLPGCLDEGTAGVVRQRGTPAETPAIAPVKSRR